MAAPDFIDRPLASAALADELASVQDTSRGFVSVRGRRRVGKSTLVEHFLDGAQLPFVFFTATRDEDANAALGRFIEHIAESDLPASADVRGGLRPTTWEGAFRLIANATEAERPCAVVLDEFPWLAAKAPTIEGELQTVWDRVISRVPVLLIIVGSDLAMMKALTEYGRPLYGRPREIDIHPMSPGDISRLLSLDAIGVLDAYTVIGGFPQLAKTWRASDTVASYLRRTLRDPIAPVIVNGERAVTAEFPPETQPRRILSAIGSGERAFGKLVDRVGISQNALHEGLHALEAKRVIRRLTPFAAGPKSRATRYVVHDPYLRFWLRFIEPNLDLIERGRSDVALKRILASWPEYRGRAIEPIVRASIEQMLPDERLGDAMFVGGYWTRDSKVEVDLVGAPTEKSDAPAAFIGTVKWRVDDPLTRSDRQALAAVRSSVPNTSDATLLVGVSRRGFDSDAGLDAAFGPQDLVDAWN